MAFMGQIGGHPQTSVINHQKNLLFFRRQLGKDQLIDK